MDFILFYRSLKEEGIISSAQMDSLMESYRRWLSTGSLSIFNSYGIVYYKDRCLYSMPIQIGSLKPLGVEINGVFYLNKCENKTYYDAQKYYSFVFGAYPKTKESEIEHALKSFKKRLLLTDWGEKEPNFELELPTKSEICALCSCADRNHYIKGIFIEKEMYWMKSSQTKEIKPLWMHVLPFPNESVYTKEETADGEDFEAIVLPVVHQGPNTFIGHLNEFEALDDSTLEMYQKLTADTK